MTKKQEKQPKKPGLWSRIGKAVGEAIGQGMFGGGR